MCQIEGSWSCEVSSFISMHWEVLKIFSLDVMRRITINSFSVLAVKCVSELLFKKIFFPFYVPIIFNEWKWKKNVENKEDAHLFL